MTGEELLIFEVSDDELERAAPIIGGVASVETLNFATAILMRLPGLVNTQELRVNDTAAKAVVRFVRRD